MPLGYTVFPGQVPISGSNCFGGSSKVPTIIGYIKEWGFNTFKVKALDPATSNAIAMKMTVQNINVI